MNWLLFIAGRGENKAGQQTGTKQPKSLKYQPMPVLTLAIKYGGDLQRSDYESYD